MIPDEQMEFTDVYANFLEKFKPKKTTDDCYTPENIYNAVRDYVCRRWNIDPASIVRPFWPGADYRRTEYPDGCLVLDNPPFSIFSQIIKFYCTNDIKFFLFGPGLTLFAGGDKRACYMPAGTNITYANGAQVMTGFAHNLEPELFAESCPELHDLIEKIDKENRKKGKKEVRKLELPQEVLTAARLQFFSVHGTALKIRKSDALFIRKLDSLPSGIFGGGLLLTERAAAEAAAAEAAAAAAAERAAAKRAAAERCPLSEREQELRRMMALQNI